MNKKYQILVIDPPYSFTDKLKQSDIKRGAEANYSILTNDQISSLPIQDIVDQDGAIMALWVPSSLLNFGIELLDIYGFNLKQSWIWVKSKKDPLQSLKSDMLKYLKKEMKIDQVREIINEKISNFDLNNILSFGMGRISRNVHEIALIGTCGNMNKKIKNKSQRTVFIQPNYKHSKKPEDLQDKLDLIFPDPSLNRIEIFGRRSRHNWTVIGNQSPESFGIDIFDSLNEIIKG